MEATNTCYVFHRFCLSTLCFVLHQMPREGWLSRAGRSGFLSPAMRLIVNGLLAYVEIDICNLSVARKSGVKRKCENLDEVICMSVERGDDVS